MTFIIDILKSIVYGIVQGITEWLPISSTGHLILFGEFLPFSMADPSKSIIEDPFFNVFKVVIQLGSVLAVLVLFFHKLNPFSSKKTREQRDDTLNLWGKVLVASIPAGIMGILFDDVIDGVLSRWFVIAATLIIYGIFFIVMESRERTPRVNEFSGMSYRAALFIGVFQMLALIPGTSRSGATILGAVLLGCSRTVAAEFSFFMAIPVMFGASGIKILRYLLDGETLFGDNLVLLLVGFAAAFLVSLLVIRFFMDFIKKHSFKGFGYYRIALGIVVIVFFTLRALLG